MNQATYAWRRVGGCRSECGSAELPTASRRTPARWRRNRSRYNDTVVRAAADVGRRPLARLNSNQHRPGPLSHPQRAAPELEEHLLQARRATEISIFAGLSLSFLNLCRVPTGMLANVPAVTNSTMSEPPLVTLAAACQSWWLTRRFSAAEVW